MKTPHYLFLFQLACVLFLWANTAAAQRNTPGITFYSEGNYTGASVALPAVGGYSTNSLLALGMPSDKALSSLHMTPGYEVVAFDGDNFTGDSVALQGDFDCLTTLGWNERVSSVKIRAVEEALTALRIQNASTQRDTPLAVYPNPVVDQLYLHAAVPLAGSRYRILSAAGTTLASGSLPQGALPVATLPAGLYTLIVVAKEGQTISRRFLK